MSKKVIVVGERDGFVPRYFTSKNGPLRFALDGRGAYKYHSKSHAQYDCDQLNKQEQSKAQQVADYVPYVYTLQNEDYTVPVTDICGNGFQMMWLNELDDFLKAGPLPVIAYAPLTVETYLPGEMIEFKTYNRRTLSDATLNGAQEQLYRALGASIHNHARHTRDTLRAVGVCDIQSRVPGLCTDRWAQDPLLAVKDPQHFHAVFPTGIDLALPTAVHPVAVVIIDAQTGEQVTVRGSKLLGLLAALEATGMPREPDEVEGE